MSLKANEQLPFSEMAVWLPALIFFLAAAAFVVTELKVAKPILRLRVLGHRTSACKLSEPAGRFGKKKLTFHLFRCIIAQLPQCWCCFWAYLYISSVLRNCAFVLWCCKLFSADTKELQVHLLPSSQAGARMLPYSLAVSAGSLGAGFIMRRTGTYRNQLIGATALVLCSFVFLCTSAGQNANIGDWLQVIRQCFAVLSHPFHLPHHCFLTAAGVGYGALLTSSLVALIRAADRSDMAMSTSMSYLFRYSGQV